MSVRVKLRVSLVLGALVAAAFVPGAATAVGTGDPVITAPPGRTPTSSPTVPEGYVGPVTVDMSDAPVGSYEVRVGEDSVQVPDYTFSQQFEYTGDRDVYSFSLPDPINEPGEYFVTVGSSTGDSVTTIFVVRRPLVVGNVSVTPSRFFPLVREGFRDDAVVGFTLNQWTWSSVRIRNAQGRPVYFSGLSQRPPGPNTVAWNGRSRTQRPVPAGTYTVEVNAHTAGNPRTTISRTVRVGSLVRTHRDTDLRSGDRLTGLRTTPGCSVTRNESARTATLTCRKARFAQAWYRFSLPANAFRVTSAVVGESRCCPGGTVTRQLERTGPGTYRVGVRVTGRRGYTVEQVRIRYSWRQRL